MSRMRATKTTRRRLLKQLAAASLFGLSDATLQACGSDQASGASGRPAPAPTTAAGRVPGLTVAQASATVAEPATTFAPAPATATPAASASSPAPADVAAEPRVDAPAAAVAVAQPAMVLPPQWGARPPRGEFRRHAVDRITLHHEGVVFDGAIPAPRYLRKVQRWSMDERGWPDIPYHFLIDLAGIIYAGRPVDAVGDTGTGYDPTGHALIAVIGHYDLQQPNAEQIEAVVVLMTWLAAQHSVPVARIAGHRDFIPLNDAGKHWDQRSNSEITCPGANLYALLENGRFAAEVQRRLSPDAS